MRNLQALLPSAAVFVAALVLSAPAVPRETEDDYTFFDTLDVEVVNVDVIVVDQKGQPVRGLTAADFELTEDGSPVEITNFYAVDEARPVPAPPGGEPAPPVPEPLSPDQSLHLAVFVDGTTLEPINKRQVFDAVREFFRLGEARPTSVVLASYDGSLEVTPLDEFDPALLDSHLAVLAKAATRGAIGQMSRRSILSQLDRASHVSETAASEAKGILDAIQAYAEQHYNEARLSTQALESFVEALAGLPGRKALLYVSGGLARNPGEALYYAWGNKFQDYTRSLGVNVAQESRRLDLTPELNRLVRHANANRVTIYAIGAGRSGKGGGAVSAEEGSFDMAAIGTSGGGRNWSAGLDSIDASNMGSSLQEMAAATGGLSMTSARNYGALLADMNRDLASYYSLGYTPDRAPDGETHRIRVRVAGRKDLQIRHREHYRERTREEIMTGRTRSAVLLGSRNNPLEVAMEFGNVAADEKNRFLVPVMVKVPLGKLVLLPQEDVHVGRIGIFVCARDDKGRTSAVQSIDVPIRIPNDQLLTALGQVAGYRMVLEMRAAGHEVAVGVRDELGRVESTVTRHWEPTTPVG